MKILFLTSGNRVPSTRFRVLPYLPSLRAAGHTCTVLSSFPQKYEYFPTIGWRASQWLMRTVRRWHLLRARLGKYDVIVLERELFDDPTWEFEQRFRNLAPVMMLDVDDAIFLRNPEKFQHIAAMCDHVLAGNQLLADEVKRHCGEVSIVPTAVEPSDYDGTNRVPNDPPVIGWIGTTANVEYLKPLVPVLESLQRERRFVLRIVTGGAESVEAIRSGSLDVQFRQWSPETAAHEIARFDVGIMPLPDTDWTRYKCGFKLLQYMAASLPAVASPVGVNCEIVAPGQSGFLPGSDDEWLNALRRLLDDEPLRRTMGERGRAIVEESYTVAANLPKILSAIESASDGTAAGRE